MEFGVTFSLCQLDSRAAIKQVRCEYLYSDEINKSVVRKEVEIIGNHRDHYVRLMTVKGCRTKKLQLA